MFGIEKESRFEGPVAKFAKSNVLAADDLSDKETVVRKLINSDRNSVILVNRERRPTGIVSMRVVLQALAELERESRIPIAITNKADLSPADIDHVRFLLERCADKLSKRSPIDRVEAVLQATKNPVGKNEEFGMTLHALFSSGETHIANGKDRDLEVAVRGAIERIERQTRRKERKSS